MIVWNKNSFLGTAVSLIREGLRVDKIIFIVNVSNCFMLYFYNPDVYKVLF